MIQGFLNACFNVLEGLLSFLPSFGFVNRFVEGMNGIAGYMYEASAFIPTIDLFICVGLVSTFYVGLFAVRCINWVIHRIPFLN